VLVFLSNNTFIPTGFSSKMNPFQLQSSRRQHRALELISWQQSRKQTLYHTLKIHRYCKCRNKSSQTSSFLRCRPRIISLSFMHFYAIKLRNGHDHVIEIQLAQNAAQSDMGGTDLYYCLRRTTCKPSLPIHIHTHRFQSLRCQLEPFSLCKAPKIT
jgi:hypothetical protein